MPTRSCSRPRGLRRLCAAATASALLALSGAAAAYHTDDDHITDDTAWTLSGDKSFRLGVFKGSFTVADRLEVGTYVLPWAALAPSVFAKVRFLSLGPSQWAVEGGLFHVDTGVFARSEPTAPVFTIGTLTLASTLRLAPHHQLSNNLVGTLVHGTGRIEDSTLEGTGEGALTNLQYVGAYEYRISRTLALVITGRYRLLQVLEAESDFTARPDDYTSVDVELAARGDQIINFSYAFSIIPALAWSWESFNLRLGVGYGNFNVPGVNFMIDKRTPIPEFDLYWTF